jgi:hypothetical protein
VDARLRAAFARLDEVVKIALHTPKRAVRLSLSRVEMSKGRRVDLTATWSNPGTEPVAIRAPGSLVSAENGWLEISTWAATPPARQELRAKVTAIEEVARVGGVEVAGGVTTLAPRAALSYRATATLAGAEEGSAFVRLSYANFLAELAGITLVTGEVLAIAQVTIPGPAAGARAP